MSWKVHNCFLHFIYFSVSLGNEERVSSPMSALVFIVSVVGLWWVLEAAEVLWFLQQDQERSWWSFRCSRLSDGCSQLLTAPSQGWLLPDVPFFGFLPQKSPGFSTTGMSNCRRRWSCPLGCVTSLPFLYSLGKISFLWNVAQGCFFLQNESELAQFSCKTLSCLRGPLFKNKGTQKTIISPKNSFGGCDCH